MPRWAKTASGQTVLGQIGPNRFVTCSGQYHFRPMPLQARPVWARPGPPQDPFCPPPASAGLPSAGPPSAGHPALRLGWGHEGWKAQNFALFFPSPATIFFLSSLSWGSSWNCGGVFEGRGPQINVHVWALGLSPVTQAPVNGLLGFRKAFLRNIVGFANQNQNKGCRSTFFIEMTLRVA